MWQVTCTRLPLPRHVRKAFCTLTYFTKILKIQPKKACFCLCSPIYHLSTAGVARNMSPKPTVWSRWIQTTATPWSGEASRKWQHSMPGLCNVTVNFSGTVHSSVLLLESWLCPVVFTKFMTDLIGFHVVVQIDLYIIYVHPPLRPCYDFIFSFFQLFVVPHSRATVTTLSSIRRPSVASL